MHRIRPNIITIIIFLFAILTLFCHQIKRIFASVLCLFKCLRNNIFQKVFKTGFPFVCTNNNTYCANHTDKVLFWYILP